jgi:phage baseplate assembly protein W
MTDIDFPYAVDARGRTATTGTDDHIRDLIAQVLFTAPGERVMRPDFGSGLLTLTFEPNSVQVAAATQMVVQAALQQWLGRIIGVEDVEVDAVDSTLTVSVTYTVLRTRQRRVDQFTAPGGAS